MARQRNDGRGRLGGRAKGVPNKVTGTLKDFIASLINQNRVQIEKDLVSLTPKERLQIIEKFMQYVLPKQRDVLLTEEARQPPTGRYDFLPDDVLFEMADKIQEAERLERQKAEEGG